ncbi:hypothetical protein Bca4012_026672 [Brassica carinata]
MAPDACVAAPRAPDVLLHDQDGMHEDTTSSTSLKAWTGGMHIDTTLATCQSACFDRRLSGTSCFCVSLCML